MLSLKSWKAPAVNWNKSRNLFIVNGPYNRSQAESTCYNALRSQMLTWYMTLNIHPCKISSIQLENCPELNWVELWTFLNHEQAKLLCFFKACYVCRDAIWFNHVSLRAHKNQFSAQALELYKEWRRAPAQGCHPSIQHRNITALYSKPSWAPQKWHFSPPTEGGWKTLYAACWFHV